MAEQGRSRLRVAMSAWLPAIGWMAVIFIASTDLMSAEHTSRFIGPFLRWLDPNISAEAVRETQFAVRKLAHVTEYAILAALLWRALRLATAANGASWWIAGIAFLVAGVYSAGDEFHQTFVPSRTASVRDVLVDCIGASVGLLLCRAASMRATRK